MQSQIEEELAQKKQQEIQKQQERQQKIEEISRTVPVVNTRKEKRKTIRKKTSLSNAITAMAEKTKMVSDIYVLAVMS